MRESQEGGLTSVSSDECSPETLAAAGERNSVLALCVRELGDRKALLLELRYREEMTFGEIAQEFGVVESAAHSMHARLLRTLRIRLEELGIFSLRDML